jgi:hypothetical protein
MAANAVIAGVYLPPAASHTAGDVGAMHHDMSPPMSPDYLIRIVVFL